MAAATSAVNGAMTDVQSASNNRALIDKACARAKTEAGAAGSVMTVRGAYVWTFLLSHMAVRFDPAAAGAVEVAQVVR